MRGVIVPNVADVPGACNRASITHREMRDGQPSLDVVCCRPQPDIHVLMDCVSIAAHAIMAVSCWGLLVTCPLLKRLVNREIRFLRSPHLHRLARMRDMRAQEATEMLIGCAVMSAAPRDHLATLGTLFRAWHSQRTRDPRDVCGLTRLAIALVIAEYH